MIPFEPLWEQYKRLIRDNRAIVLTASQPFTSALAMSNPKMFKYEWIWDKGRPSGFVTAKTIPLKQHENILVFGGGIYNFQKRELPESYQKRNNRNRTSKTRMKDTVYGDMEFNPPNRSGVTTGYPKTILSFQKQSSNQFVKSIFHPTQKPVALFEYLIKTYTNEGDTILDNCAGSGTTAIACMKTNRKYIMIEKEEKYCEIAAKRIEKENQQLKLFQT